MTEFRAKDILPERMTFALSYPFIRPKNDFVYIDGVSYQIADRNFDHLKDWRVQAGNKTLSISDVHDDAPDLQDMQPVIAAGSNGAPLQLNRKFSQIENTIIPCIKLHVKDFTPCYLKAITHYGSIPASLMHTPGTSGLLPITFLDQEALAHMNETEGLGEHYTLIDVPDVDFKNSDLQDNFKALAYQGTSPHLDMALDTFEIQNSRLSHCSQWDAQEEIIKLLDLNMAVGQFIWENLTNEELREERNNLLLAL